MTRLRFAASVSAIALLCLGAGPARAQQPADGVAIDAPAHVSFVDGTATLERDGRPDSSLLNMPLLAGDRIRTQSGRVEVLFGDGSVLHMDSGTVIDFESDELMRLLSGRVRLAIPGAARSVSYRIDAPWASAEIGRSGEYRLGIVGGDGADEIELDVLRGAADLANEQGRTPLGAGERAFARANTAPSSAYVYNSASWDAFDQWSETRRDQRMGASAAYLPEDVRAYSASFDQYGSWDYQPSYGYVWYPRVAVGWRPYYNGRWATLRPYGWTWIGSAPWAWPTHHYGRWGFSADAGFWIPGRRWGAAWVSWAYAPGYVSWCPLGWNNRAVIGIGYGHARGYDPWRAWTVVPDRHFRAGSVNVRNAGRFDLDSHTRSAFAQGTHAPAYGGTAVPRGSAPIRIAGTQRRSSSSPLYTNMDPRDSRVGNAPSRTVVGPSGPPASDARGQRRPASAPPSYGGAGGTPAPRTPVERPNAPAPNRSGYGRIEPSPPRAPGSRVYGEARPYGDSRANRDAAMPRRGIDMGVGGNTPSPDTRGGDDRPYGGSYGRPAPDRGTGDGSGADMGIRRAMPRGDAPDYRPSGPREARAPDAGPPRPAAPAPRASAPESRGGGRERPPSASAPSGSAPPARSGGYVRPNGAAPSGQAAPRGRGGH
jgi:hypothetical protein